MKFIRLKKTRWGRLGLSVCLLSVFLSAFVTISWSQATQQFTGQVVDSTGAVIPGAQVSVRNMATGVVTKTETTSVGAYTVSYLVPAVYSITISKPGFKTGK